MKQSNKIRTSEFIDCGRNTGSCIADKSPKGIVLHPTLNVTAAGGKDAAQGVFKLLKAGAGGVDFKMTDVDETIVLKYVNPQVDLFQGSLTNGSRQSAGYWTIQPLMHCVEGVLNDCGGNGDFQNGTPITACGYQVQSDVKPNEPGMPIYGGGSTFVEAQGGDNLENGPAPPSYDSVADQATAGVKTSGGSRLGFGAEGLVVAAASLLGLLQLL